MYSTIRYYMNQVGLSASWSPAKRQRCCEQGEGCERLLR